MQEEEGRGACDSPAAFGGFLFVCFFVVVFFCLFFGCDTSASFFLPE